MIFSGHKMKMSSCKSKDKEVLWNFFFIFKICLISAQFNWKRTEICLLKDKKDFWTKICPVNKKRTKKGRPGGL